MRGLFGSALCTELLYVFLELRLRYFVTSANVLLPHWGILHRLYELLFVVIRIGKNIWLSVCVNCFFFTHTINIIIYIYIYIYIKFVFFVFCFT